MKRVLPPRSATFDSPTDAAIPRHVQVGIRASF